MPECTDGGGPVSDVHLPSSRLYRFFDLVVASNVDLGGTQVVAGVVDCVFILHDAPMLEPDGCHWSVTYETPSPWLSIGDDDASRLIRIHEMAEFRVARDGSQVDCYPLIHLPRESLSHLLVDQVLPLVLAGQGKTVLHASAVLTARGVVAFIGETGVGKSTLAASFSVSGLPVLTDDCLLVDEVDDAWIGLSSSGEIHLWEDIAASLFGAGRHTDPVAHYTDKCRIRLPTTSPVHADRRGPLLAVYHLKDADDGVEQVTIRRASQQRAFHAFIGNAFRADFSRARARHELETLTRLAATVPLSTLSYPRAVPMLPSVRRAVLDDCGCLGMTS